MTMLTTAHADDNGQKKSQALWHTVDAGEALVCLDTDAASGLCEDEIRARQARYGPNALEETPPTPLWARFLEQFRSFVVLILIVAAALSFLLGDYIETAAILTIVLLNASLGVIQEARAEAALTSLREMAAPVARVLRAGHYKDVPAQMLVPGDVVVLQPGHYVPADLRLLESVNLRVDESPFTGESLPVTKDALQVLSVNCPLAERANLAYMGTIITYGRGRGVVVATGMETEIGQIAALMQAQVNPPTPLQVSLDELGRRLSYIALALCAMVFVGGVLRNYDWLNMLLVAVSLAIAAVPEGLPAVVTISLALGMREMVRRKAIIRKLPAVETLGATTVICTDKTGTITQNQMRAVHLYVDEARVDVAPGLTDDGAEDRRGVELLLRGALLCNDALLESGGGNAQAVGDPTEVALITAAQEAGLRREAEQQRAPRLNEIPFQSERKRMSTLHQEEDGYRLWCKGAPEVLLGQSDFTWQRGHSVPLTPALREHWEAVLRDFAQEGLRILSVAYRDFDAPPTPLTEEHESGLTFVGLLALVDPARPEVSAAVTAARRAGVRTLMITGDQPLTAQYIARQVGILRPGHGALLGTELEAMHVAELADHLESTDVVARASPAHKVKIVEALQANNHVVAMTGDGVNDAPALKRAEVGVAMGIAGTDVAKEAAEMVLADDNYASIVGAIEQGRVVYDNIRKFVYYLLSCNVAEILVLFIGTLAGWPPVLEAVQLLWLNLITDGAPALALGLEKGDPDILQRPPRQRDEAIIDRFMVTGIVVQSIALTSVTLLAYLLGRGSGAADLTRAETMAFATLSAAELLRAYTARSERRLLLELGLFSNRYMQLAVGLSLLLLLAVIYIPVLQPVFDTVALSSADWAKLLPLILLPSLAAEATKWWQARHDRVAEAVE